VNAVTVFPGADVYARLDGLRAFLALVLADDTRDRETALELAGADLEVICRQVPAWCGGCPGRGPGLVCQVCGAPVPARLRQRGRVDVVSAWLDGELAAVRGELARADGKCGTLTAIATGAAAFTATQATHGPLAARVVLASAGAVFAGAVLVLLAALRPRTGTAGWCRYLVIPAGEIADLDRRGWAVSGFSGGTRWARELAAEDLGVLACLADAKYRLVRSAIGLTGAGVVLLAAGIAAGVIA
jgi:hypothetical protein